MLAENWIGGATRPGPHLYPHQWSWDSAFIAIGYAGYDEERARGELRALFAGQWSNGMLPQIVFPPEHDAYFPGPDVWRTDLSPHAPRSPRTSGIVQPPLHASAVWRMHELAREREASGAFLAESLPGLRAWHDYLYRERDLDGDGLVAIRHPWESGMDDSPLWDEPLGAIELAPDRLPSYRRVDLTRVAAHERPSQSDYDHYVHLVELFKRYAYDEAALREHCPFQVADPLFNALLAQAGEDLARIAEAAGEDGAPFREQAARTRAALNARLWSAEHGRYVAFDLHGRRELHAPVASCFCPLFSGAPSPEQAAAMLRGLDSPGFWQLGGEGHPVPTYDRRAPGFAPRRYWRGPVWANIDWLLIRGLERHGFGEYAAALRGELLGLVERAGFREYFDPGDGAGLGSERFSWSAALVLDLLRD